MKKLLSVLLSVCLMLSLTPVTAFAEDTTAPVINAGSIEVITPDSSRKVTEGDSVRFAVEIADNEGVASASVSFVHNETERRMNTDLAYNSNSGKWEGDVTVSEREPSGIWCIQFINASDASGNEVDLHNSKSNIGDYEPNMDLSAYDFTVTGTNPDVTAPVINASSISVTTPDSGREVIIGDTVQFSAAITDNIEVTNASVEFIHKNTMSSNGEKELKYNSESGKWECSFTIFQSYDLGAYGIYYIHANDANGNGVKLYNSDINSSAETSADLSSCDFTVAESCKISFNTRGGSLISPIYVKKGEKATAPESPTKENAYLACWYKDAALTERFDFDYDKVESDMTLYASWYYDLSVTNWDKTTAKENVGGSYDIAIGDYIDDKDCRGCMNTTVFDTAPVVSLKANPEIGYLFTGWFEGVYTGSAGGQSAEPIDVNNSQTMLSNKTEYNYYMDNNSVIVAVFEECKNHVSDGGTVTKQPTYTEQGTKVFKCTKCRKEYKTEPVPTLPKKANTFNVSAKTVKLKARKLKKKAQKIALKKAFTVSDAKGSVSFKKIKGNKKISINAATGKITVKKGLKKGTYKVTVNVTDSGSSVYAAATKTVIVKIRVK